TLSWACQKVSTLMPSASAKSSAAPIVRTQLLRLPSATRMTQSPPLLLRLYPSPRPFATRMNVGLIAGAHQPRRPCRDTACGGADERQGSTLSGHSGPRRNSNRRAPTYGTVLGAGVAERAIC